MSNLQVIGRKVRVRWFHEKQNKLHILYRVDINSFSLRLSSKQLNFTVITHFCAVCIPRILVLCRFPIFKVEYGSLEKFLTGKYGMAYFVHLVHLAIHRAG